MIINTNVFMHDSDRAALQALKAIPGFTQLLKAFMKVWNERQFHITNMSSRLRLGENQMAKYYNMLPPICEKLGIEVPELYLELDVNPNAYTSGDTKPFIVITSGLLETLPDELIPTVLAHECGHIACHHVLYTTMGRMILSGVFNLAGFSPLVTTPLQMAFAYWMRCSEFSADRAAVIFDGSADKMKEVCMRLAGFDKDIMADASMDTFMEQALEYKEMINNSKWDKTLEFVMFKMIDHPLMSVRAYECDEWAHSEQYVKTVRYLAGDQSILGDLELSTREIPMMEASKYYVGKNYHEVCDMLVDAGFSDIKVVKTIEKGLFTKTEQTVKIQINDDDVFEKGAWYPEDSAILITYYESETPEEIAAAHAGQIQVPDASRKYVGRNYKEVINELGDAGFGQFIEETQVVKKSRFAKENCIVKISINGQTQFSKGDWFAPDSKIRVTYQTVVEEK
ncbi:MAG: M48 family metalloprotease [Faecalicatena sp.]|uniref:M48 family metalloprotease n=1 Tax=Faecalicatena sp. TaxID=2005360 RepID=UPI0025873C39|nr:M48 family metalloprotease [Faecalicatena sp.]MCI6466801.1 M48 family metalloprotease [Faecalicatena sp.]MDY5620594.1 M48 family metalloprotease [Lachnospiraceae bacterium]